MAANLERLLFNTASLSVFVQVLRPTRTSVISFTTFIEVSKVNSEERFEFFHSQESIKIFNSTWLIPTTDLSDEVLTFFTEEIQKFKAVLIKEMLMKI